MIERPFPTAPRIFHGSECVPDLGRLDRSKRLSRRALFQRRVARATARHASTTATISSGSRTCFTRIHQT